MPGAWSGTPCAARRARRGDDRDQVGAGTARRAAPGAPTRCGVSACWARLPGTRRPPSHERDSADRGEDEPAQRQPARRRRRHGIRGRRAGRRRCAGRRKRRRDGRGCRRHWRAEAFGRARGAHKPGRTYTGAAGGEISAGLQTQARTPRRAGAYGTGETAAGTGRSRATAGAAGVRALRRHQAEPTAEQGEQQDPQRSQGQRHELPPTVVS